MAGRFLLCAAVLPALSLLLSGCDGGGGGSRPGGTCAWNVGKFEKFSAAMVAAKAPEISKDGQTATCEASEPCAARGSLTPLMPGEYPKSAEGAKCNGTYSYVVKVPECGRLYDSTTGGWNNQAGWHTTDPSYSAGGFGIDLWTRKGTSCEDSGWMCDCVGQLEGDDSAKPVRGNLTLEVTMDTTKWPIYAVKFVPPPGATGPGGPGQGKLVEPRVVFNDIDAKFLSQFQPTFMLSPGAKFRLVKEASGGAPPSGELVV